MPPDGTPAPAHSSDAPPAEASSPTDQRLRKADRILRRPDFVRIQRTGLRYKTGKLTVVWLPALGDRTRIGITVSKKVGNSPTRSRVKRWIREVFRTHKTEWPLATDFVVIARPGLARAGFERVKRDMLRWAAHVTGHSGAADRQIDDPREAK